MEYKVINIKINNKYLFNEFNNKYSKTFQNTSYLYVFDYNVNKIYCINVPSSTIDKDVPNILEEYGLKESECNYMLSEYPRKIINLTHEDKIINKEDKM